MTTTEAPPTETGTQEDTMQMEAVWCLTIVAIAFVIAAFMIDYLPKWVVR